MLSPKKSLLVAWTTAAVMTVAGSAQALMITEYVETIGIRNNAIELTNETLTPQSLAGFTLDLYNNGSGSIVFQIALDPVILNPGETWVVVPNVADDPAVLAAADQLAAWFLFSGDDAIVLSDAGTPVDSIGQVGFDPGLGWGTLPTSTHDATLQRNPAAGPDPNPFDAFDPTSEWTALPSGDFSGLGTPPVPEPSTAALLLVGLALARRLATRPST